MRCLSEYDKIQMTIPKHVSLVLFTYPTINMLSAYCKSIGESTLRFPSHIIFLV